MLAVCRSGMMWETCDIYPASAGRPMVEGWGKEVTPYLWPLWWSSTGLLDSRTDPPDTGGTMCQTTLHRATHRHKISVFTNIPSFCASCHSYSPAPVTLPYKEIGQAPTGLKRRLTSMPRARFTRQYTSVRAIMPPRSCGKDTHRLKVPTFPKQPA